MNEPFVSTKDRPGSYDAIETAKPGEPLFPLQGGDPFAPPSILHWAGLVREAALKETNKDKAAQMLRKASDAEQVAWTFLSYQRGEETIAGTRASYNDRIVVEADEARTQREAMIKGAGRLHNALSEALIVAETLAKHRLHPESEVKIREAAEALRESAFAIEPRRGREQS